MNDDGTPKWRMAPSPYGPYWKDGMQNGYQDVGSWTFFKSTPPDRLAGAWLYAQFVTAKTVSLKKSIVGLTFVRDSDIRHRYFTENAANYGGLDRVLSQPCPRGLDPDRMRMCPTTPAWPSCGGRTSPPPSPETRAPRQPWTRWPARWIRCSAACSAPA